MKRYQIEYGTIDGYTGEIIERMTVVYRGHDAEHALDRFNDSDDGHVATRIRKLGERASEHGRWLEC